MASTYIGFNPSTSGWALDVVPISIDPKKFFKDYVIACKPCIIDGLAGLQANQSKNSSSSTTTSSSSSSSSTAAVSTRENWTLEALEKTAGKAIVHIEHRDPTSKTFGTGEKTPMTFSAFAAALKSGQTELYLTTQPLSIHEEDNEGEDDKNNNTTKKEKKKSKQAGNNTSSSSSNTQKRAGKSNVAISSSSSSSSSAAEAGHNDDDDTQDAPWRLFGEPLLHLTQYFPLRPSIVRSLTPSSINLWVGQSVDGSSSNLHHDFHANLYTLLAGRKQFTIAAPSQAFRMYTHGRILLVHSNGLINYAGYPTRSDGLPLSFEDDEEEDEEEEAEEVIEDSRKSKKGKEKKTMPKKTDSTKANMRLLTEEEEDKNDDEYDDDEGGGGAAADDMWAALLGAGGGRGGEGGGGTSAAVTSGQGKASMKETNRKKTETQKAAVGVKRGRSSGNGGNSNNNDDDTKKSVDQKVSARKETTTRSSGNSNSSSNIPGHFSKISLPALRQAAAVAALESKSTVTSTSSSNSNNNSSDTLYRTLQQLPQVKREYPLFVDAILTSFALEAGQSLWLPAGWFHEVVSTGNSSSNNSSRSSRDGGESSSLVPVGTKIRGRKAKPREGASASSSNPTGSVHIALNHWFAPPTKADFNKPYEDKRWEEMFDSACRLQKL